MRADDHGDRQATGHAFSGNYSTEADWDAVPFFYMLKRDLRESLFDPRTGKPIWDGITPIKARAVTLTAK